MHHRIVNGVELALDLIAGEQRHRRVFVLLHPLGMARGQHAHEGLRGLVGLVAFDLHVFDVAGVEVANRPLDQIGFFVDQGGRGGAQREFADFVPKPDQIFEIALHLRLAALAAGGAHDDRHAGGQLEILDDRLQALAVARTGDLARNPAAAVGVGHQHAISSGKRQIRGQRRALIAALFLCYLHQQNLAPFDDVLDLIAAAEGPRASRGRFLRLVAPHRLQGLGNWRRLFDDRTMFGRLIGSRLSACGRRRLLGSISRSLFG